ncbi:hypothetical protein HZA57_08015, partial [Candidatus Poribacteria bacterium]|nr:hypothetical protein [Candidatus Poribacteria bacterium]
ATPRPARRRERRRKHRAGDLFLLVVVFGLILTFVTFKPNQVFLTLYNKTAGLILIIMVVEYLAIKSTDRTRVYRIENRRLRERRRDDEALLRRSRELLAERLEQPVASDEDAQMRWKARAEMVCEDITKAI